MQDPHLQPFHMRCAASACLLGADVYQTSLQTLVLERDRWKETVTNREYITTNVWMFNFWSMQADNLAV